MAKQFDDTPGLPQMGGAAPVADAQVRMLNEVDFKWLMAGQGCWVDRERFQADGAYAEDLLRQARSSSCAALRDCATTLQRQMQATTPPMQAPKG